MALAPDSSFLLVQILGGDSEGLSGWVPAVHMGDLDCILASGFGLGLALAIVGIWE